MSSNELAFALNQHQLDVPEQLALIIIADSCHEYFTLEQAFNAVTAKTALADSDADDAVSNLCDKGYIRESTLKKIKSPSDAASYFIMVVRS